MDIALLRMTARRARAEVSAAAADQPGTGLRGADERAEQLARMLPRMWRHGLRLTRDEHWAQRLVEVACELALAEPDKRPAATPLVWAFGALHDAWVRMARAPAARRGRHDAFATLPEPEREIMLLVVVEGCDYATAAAILQVPAGTVVSRLAKARAGFDG